MRAGLLLLILSFLLLIPGTAILPLIDRDEPRFAQATWEMMETDQWVIPYFNGDYRFDKPPLTYWWMRLHFILFGKEDFASRLHSILAAGLTSIVIARLGTFLYTRQAGLLAGLGFLTCLQTLVHGRLCVADMAMILGVTATMDAVVRYLFKPSEPSGSQGILLLLYLALALAFGFLAKGPIAWIVPILSILLFAWPFGRGAARQRFRKILRVPWLSAFGIATGICLLWAVPALVQTKGAFFQVGIGTHVIERGLQPFNGRVMIPGVYYLATIVPSLLPWSAFTWQALFRGEPVRLDEKRSLLLAWYVTPFVIFSFYSTQLPHYVMPGFAAFMLLLFRDGKLPIVQGKIESAWLLLTSGITFLITVGGIAFLVMNRDRLTGDMQSILPILLWGLAAIAFVGGISPLAILIASRAANRKAPFPILGFVVFYLVGSSILTHSLASQVREVNLVTRIHSAIAEDSRPLTISSHSIGEPSLVFYLSDDHSFHFGTTAEGINPEKMEFNEKSLLIARTKTWSVFDAFLKSPHLPKHDVSEEVRAKFSGDGYHILAVEGYNPARSTWEEVLLISREP